jgi:hypothetical protein
VRWRYIGAQTRHTCEKREACAMAAPISALWTVRFELSAAWALTVG